MPLYRLPDYVEYTEAVCIEDYSEVQDVEDGMNYLSKIEHQKTMDTLVSKNNLIVRSD